MTEEKIDQEFRLKDGENYFIEEIEQNVLISKKHKKVCKILKLYSAFPYFSFYNYWVVFIFYFCFFC